MTFVADPVALRTVDIDRGIELFTAGNSPEGESRFRLVRSDGAVVHFSTQWDPVRSNEWRTENPTARKPAVHFVGRVRRVFPNQSPAETDAIILEAMTAFKGIHGRPVDSDVAVFFD